MVMEGASRRVWTLTLIAAALTVTLFWTIESATAQRGVLAVGVVIAVIEVLFVGAMTYVLGQNYCEVCGIGNLREATRCWKCGEPLVRTGVESPRDEGGSDAG